MSSKIDIPVFIIFSLWTNQRCINNKHRLCAVTALITNHCCPPVVYQALRSANFMGLCIPKYMKKGRIKIVLMFPHSVNAVYILVLVILSLCACLSVSLPASSAVSQGGSVAPGQTYASFHCTNPNAAWRNNCSSGRGFAGALSLTGSRQPGTRHFNQLSLPLSVYQTPDLLSNQTLTLHKHTATSFKRRFFYFPPRVVVAVRSSYLEHHLH